MHRGTWWNFATCQAPQSQCDNSYRRCHLADTNYTWWEDPCPLYRAINASAGCIYEFKLFFLVSNPSHSYMKAIAMSLSCHPRSMTHSWDILPPSKPQIAHIKLFHNRAYQRQSEMPELKTKQHYSYLIIPIKTFLSKDKANVFHMSHMWQGSHHMSFVHFPIQRIP